MLINAIVFLFPLYPYLPPILKVKDPSFLKLNKGQDAVIPLLVLSLTLVG
jgi:hypothetical protein